MVNQWFDVSTRIGLAVVTGLVSTLAGFIFWLALTAWQVRRVKKRILRQALANRAVHASGAVALVLSIARDIEQDVRRHLDADLKTRALPLVKVHQAGGLELREEVWVHFLERVKKQWRELAQSGVGRVYLFLNTPVAMGVYIGATLLPGPEVIIAHFQENVYHQVGSLTTAVVKL
ncbi:MAG: hypothetical protein JO112_09970 [Planctomycetes bacterium]|nr:hypothetical protein [Planctomycetota bacterium]